MFLPTTRKELKAWGWDALDVILVTGDTYIDSPFVGVAVIGRVLVNAGYRVGIIAQPDPSGDDIARLGEPELFWGVTAGCIDSMVANRTASGKKRRQDDYTPGGVNDRRPDRATIAYSNLIRKHFKGTSPIVLGGVEASLRRIPHYDFWSDKVRRSVLFDAKADYLVYGMADRTVVELADALRDSHDPTELRGLCYISKEKPGVVGRASPKGSACPGLHHDAQAPRNTGEACPTRLEGEACPTRLFEKQGAEDQSQTIELPPFSEVAADKQAFTKMFHRFYENNDPVTAVRLVQQQDTRYLVQNPPAAYLTGDELDAVHDLDYERDVHPFYAAAGQVRALDTIRFSIATHRGCYGECNFCAIAVHQGRRVRWRSKASIVREAERIAAHPQFKGTLLDVGGPTANMYGFECARKDNKGSCTDKRCIFPDVCSGLRVDHGRQLALLRALRKVEGIKRVFVASGIRYDMILADDKHGDEYLREVVKHHVSGQLKIAPEHTEDNVLAAMGKPGKASLIAFRNRFNELSRKAGKKQFLTYYMIAAHPGCTQQDMQKLKRFAADELHTRPEQVQVFTPTPSTYSTLMYWTEQDPFTGNPCHVEKSARGREQQKQVLTGPKGRKK